MLTERTTTLLVSIFYFQKCQTRDCEKKVNLCYNEVKRYRKDDDLCLVVTARLSLMTPAGI